MSDKTPLENLDDAIRLFAEATEQRGTVGAWALSYQTSWVHTDDDGTLPLVHGTAYALGPATSMSTAIGLGRAIAGIAEAHIVRAMTDEDDDQ